MVFCLLQNTLNMQHLYMQSLILVVPSHAALESGSTIPAGCIHTANLLACEALWNMVRKFHNHSPLKLSSAPPLTEWLRPLIFSTLNHSSSYHCGLAPSFNPLIVLLKDDLLIKQEHLQMQMTVPDLCAHSQINRFLAVFI